MLRAENIEIGSNLLKLFKIKLVTFFSEIRCIYLYAHGTTITLKQSSDNSTK